MKKLKDITYRHELIERYLDADTSVEEEQALADFYRHCENKDLTDEDLDIRNLMLGMENYTPNILQPVSKKHETRWVRLSAILLATAMLAGLIFLLFPIKVYFSSSSEQQPGFANLVPTEQVVRSQPSSEDEDGNLNAYEKMERADSLFLAATQDIVTPQEMKSNKIALTKRKDIAERSEKHAGKAAENTEETSSDYKEKTSGNAEKTSSEAERSIHEDFNQIYEVASAALPSAEQLTINRQGDNIVISTLDNDGTIGTIKRIIKHFTLNYKHFTLMKKYIFTIAFALLGITSSMASKADTLRIYSIDGERIPNFTGKELIGKTIKNYQINTNVLPAPKRDVTEIHIITTTTPPAPKPDPHYLIKGREQELTKEEFYKISPSKIKAIEVLKEGTKAIQERGLKEDGRSYIIVTLEK